MFGGVRDVDWTHIRVEGDRARAAGYLPQARLLLGQVRQTLATTGRSVEVVRKSLPDGTQLEAKIVGKIPVVTIRVPGVPTGDTTPVVLDGFIGVPIFQNTLRGVSGPPEEVGGKVFDEVVLSPGSDQRWTLFTYGDFPPYTTATIARTRSYRFRNGIGVYPEGMDGVGSNDWHGPRGEVLSWQSPVRSHGYLRDVGSISTFPRFQADAGGSFGVKYVKPSNLRYYDSRQVFHLGAALFSTDEYLDSDGNLATPDPYFGVAGACIRRDVDGVKLYVAQYGLPAFLQDYSIFEDDGAIQIYRYDLAPKSEAQPFLARVVNGSRVAIGAPIMLFGAYDLVTDVQFNQSGTEAALVLNPSMRTQQTAAFFGFPTLKFADPAARIMRVNLDDGSRTVASTLGDFSEPEGQFLDVTTRMSVFHHYRGDRLICYWISRRIVANSRTEVWLETPIGGRIELQNMPYEPPIEPPENPFVAWGYKAKFIHAIRPREGLVCLLSAESSTAEKTLTGNIEVWVEDAEAESKSRLAFSAEPNVQTWASVATQALEPGSPGILALGGNAMPSVWSIVIETFTPSGAVNTAYFVDAAPASLIPAAHLWGAGRSTWAEGRINEPVPYGLNTGYALGLTTDIPLGVFQQANVLTGLPSTPNAWPTIDAPGLNTNFKITHTRFVAQGSRWMLSTYLPFTADRPVTYLFDGTAVERLLGVGGGIVGGVNVSFAHLGVMGRPIFLPGA